MRQRPKPLKPKAKLPVAPKSPKNQSSKVRDLETRLAEALKHEHTELSTIKMAVGGFLVNGVRGGTTFRRWYSVQEVRQLARSGGD